MLEIFDRNRRKTAILQNAHGISEDRKINSLWYLNFSLPYNDPKNDFCQPFHYVRMNGGELYRIMPSVINITETGKIEYQCEHVLSMLLDKLMFGHHTIGKLGTYTADCIRYVLNQQETKNWTLYECDFSRQFEYSWEQENLLSALFSIATPLTDYIWKTDTSVYPWRLSLKRLDTTTRPSMYIQRGKNMLAYSRESNPEQICTRIYPLGYGEGVNQLTIKDINNGVPYLQSPQTYIDRYGLIERAWIDRRYEDAESLKAAAQAMLEELQEPAVSYEIGYAEIGEAAEIGERVRVIHPDTGGWTDTFITGLSPQYDDVKNGSITIANKVISLATSVADLADRQRIEQSYAQGATQIYSQALQANCDTKTGAVIDFIIPTEMRIINKVIAKIRMSQFLAYSNTTEVSPAIATTTATKDTISTTSTMSIEAQRTTDSTQVQYTTDNGWVNELDTSHFTYSHYHSVFTEPHTHDVNIPNHTHTFILSAHEHKFSAPAHSHEIIPGIYKFGNAKSFSIYVEGKYKQKFMGQTAEIDVTNFLLNEENKIPRDRWLTIEVRPDDLAYISIDLVFQGFVQSRGDATV